MTITAKKRPDGTVYGYWLRWNFSGDHKPKYQAQFNEKDYGNLENAYNAAETVERTLNANSGYDPKINRSKNLSKPNITARSNTGIPGVLYVARERETLAGSTYIQEYYCASWQEGPYNRKRKQFGLVKHGRKGAKKKAIEYRNKMIAKFGGNNVSN
jgi:hypothetical protein